VNSSIPFLPWAAVSGTVPGSLTVGLLHACSVEGLDPRGLFASLAPLPLPHEAPRPLAWPAACELLERLEALRPRALHTLAHQLAGSCLLACLSTAGPGSTAALFDAALGLWPRYWGVVDATAREGDGFKVMTMKLRDSHRACAAFFRLQADALRLMPVHLGAPAAHVDALIEPGGAHYRITLRP